LESAAVAIPPIKEPIFYSVRIISGARREETKFFARAAPGDLVSPIPFTLIFKCLRVDIVKAQPIFLEVSKIMMGRVWIPTI